MIFFFFMLFVEVVFVEVLCFSGFVKIYGFGSIRVIVFCGIDFVIVCGLFMVIMGLFGLGKSMLLYSVVGFDCLISGVVYFGGIEIFVFKF